MVTLGPSIVEATGIEKYFGASHVLRGVDLIVRQHETVVIIGPSGSGKTTLLRCLNCLSPPTLGTIRIGDVTVQADPLHEGGRERQARMRRLRQRVGMVFQEFNLFPHLTVLENCIEAPMSVGGKTRRDAVSIAERFLEKVHLIDKRDEYPARMSSGQKQRAAIARALSMEPEVLLFDEPTSALDAELIGEVLRVMEELAHEGATMVVVTHQILFARAAADRVLFMQQGVIVEEGPPQQVLGDPREEATRLFLRRYLGADMTGARF
ncbi:MAG TPA: amino acid ABC transporter ATP-binding protein [Candidatus Limnocylindrales bacterium]|nr:amino acid ABC transporter ATP-binding protein [Candidatus Limnocylindrales bacterium]